jgi:hypothetical protein
VDTSGRGKGKEGQIRLMYFIYVHENRAMKPTETVPRSGGEGRRENDRDTL